MLADTTTTWVIVAALLLIGAGLAAWWGLVHRRRGIWRRFARRHGLRIVERGIVPRLEGVIEGRPFSLGAASGGSDAEELGIVETEMNLGLHGTMPAGLEIEDATGVIGEAQRVLEEGAMTTGDDELDHAAVVRSDDPAGTRVWLTPPRRRAFVEFAARHPSGAAGLAAGRIYLRDRELVSRLEELESRLELLLRMAPAFDSDPRHQQASSTQ